MKCPAFDELMAFLDGEAAEDREVLIEEHLAACPRCRAVLESQGAVEKAWRDSFRYPPGERFREMEERIAWRLASGGARRSRWSVLIPAVAAAAAVLLGVKLILLQGPELPSAVPDLVPAGADRYETAGQPGSGGRWGSPDGEAGLQAAEEPVELEEREALGTEGAGGEPMPGPGVDDLARGFAEDGQEADRSLVPGATRPGEAVPPADGGATLSGLLGGNTAHAAGDLVESRDQSEQSIAQNRVTDGLLSGEEALEEEILPVECLSEGGGSGTLYGVGGGGGGASSGSAGLGAAVPEEPLETGSEAVTCTTVSGDEVSPDETSPYRSASGTSQADAPETVGYWEVFLDADAVGGGEADEASGQVTVDLCSVLECTSSRAMEAQAVLADDAGDPAAPAKGLKLVLDPLGLPDAATSALLDSLFPDWRLYIPFALRDTVLIAAPGEVRSRLTGEASPVQAEEPAPAEH